MLPIVGVKFPWLTAHWVAGIVLTAAIVFHIVRSLFRKDLATIWIKPSDLAELTGGSAAPLPGKYSLAQKGMHLAMAVLVLVATGTGIALLAQIDTPWWARSNFLSEAALGWMFLLHGLSTLVLIGFAALHLYFTARPEKQFYLRAMVKGWVSRAELAAHHDPARWTPNFRRQPGHHRRSPARPRRRRALTTLSQHIETIEAGYEFLLAYAAQGRIAEDRTQPRPPRQRHRQGHASGPKRPEVRR